jgi:hypothetical protein
VVILIRYKHSQNGCLRGNGGLSTCVSWQKGTLRQEKCKYIRLDSILRRPKQTFFFTIPIPTSLLANRPWGPSSLLYNEYQVSVLVVKRMGRGVYHPASSNAEVKEWVELYPYSPSGPWRPVRGWTSLHHSTPIRKKLHSAVGVLWAVLKIYSL